MSADGEQDTPQPLARTESRDLAAMDGFDLLLLLALLPLHWTLFFLVVAQWFIRRNPRLLAGLLSYVGADHLRHHPAAAELLPGLRHLPPPAPGTSATPGTPTRSNQVLHTLLAAAPAQTPPAAQPAAAPARTAAAPLPFTHWRKLVLAAHNVIVVGVPQSGKSTLTRAFLPALANIGQICLIDPHDQANDWPWPALGSGRDYAAIEQALADLTDEMNRRYRRPRPHPPLVAVIDEVPSITLHRRRAWETHYPQLVFEGAKVQITTWVLTQSAQVKPLGLEGKGDLRDSLLFLYLGPFAVEQCPACAGQPYPAAIEHHGQVHAIDTTPLAVYAQLPVPEEAQWHAPTAAPHEPPATAPAEDAAPHEPPATAPPADTPPAGGAADTDARIAPAGAEEIRKLSRALRHAARGAGKHEAIYVGWGLKRGGGPQYKRAEALFDLALNELEEANDQ